MPMPAPIPAPLPWWKTFLSEGNGTGSSRRALLLLSVAATLAICAWGVHRGKLPQEVKDLLTWLNTFLVGLAGWGRSEERKETVALAAQGPAGPPKPPAAPGGPP